ncbi:Lipopolysaccharide export system ATP-binding protein LptB [archaeon HR01]|nr:Lipopolysaccharide export system ATP-binding protein LptB [archaeon HR01]
MASVEDVPLLETQGLSKRFAGLEAVKSVDLRLEKETVRAIIGPNGAGKTTLVNLISGRLKPTSGKIYYRGVDITNLPAHKRASMGIVYTFQIVSLFPSLTVFENVVLAVQRRLGRGILLRLDRDSVYRQSEKALELVGLEDEAELEAGALPYGHQRLLDIAMALALQPVLLILDEPTQGLSAGEIEKITDLVKKLSKNTTILLIEHNISVVMELAHKITVMADGSILAEGPPSEVEKDVRVQSIYLGV